MCRSGHQKTGQISLFFYIGSGGVIKAVLLFRVLPQKTIAKLNIPAWSYKTNPGTFFGTAMVWRGQEHFFQKFKNDHTRTFLGKIRWPIAFPVVENGGVAGFWSAGVPF